jgi:hypothetical protein
MGAASPTGLGSEVRLLAVREALKCTSRGSALFAAAMLTALRPPRGMVVTQDLLPGYYG